MRQNNSIRLNTKETISDIKNFLIDVGVYSETEICNLFNIDRDSKTTNKNYLLWEVLNGRSSNRPKQRDKLDMLIRPKQLFPQQVGTVLKETFGLMADLTGFSRYLEEGSAGLEVRTRKWTPSDMMEQEYYKIEQITKESLDIHAALIDTEEFSKKYEFSDDGVEIKDIYLHWNDEIKNEALFFTTWLQIAGFGCRNNTGKYNLMAGIRHSFTDDRLATFRQRLTEKLDEATSNSISYTKYFKEHEASQEWSDLHLAIRPHLDHLPYMEDIYMVYMFDNIHVNAFEFKSEKLFKLIKHLTFKYHSTEYVYSPRDGKGLLGSNKLIIGTDLSYLIGDNE